MTRLLCRLAAPSLALALFAGAALAQTAPAQPSASHMALATEVALGSGIPRSFDSVITPLLDELRQMQVARPEIKKDLEDVVEMLKPEMELQKRRMVTATARAFATHMTEAELRDVAAFFKSPAGRKYVEKQPQVFDDIMKEMATWAREVEEYVLVRAKAEMQKRGHPLN
ncbi:MAG TPA: DUF2059 domain-containing protein [Microvirga sp.]|jgi:hypothetical protein|nr:DUF2059 domain-containing protein [Microvirga sp.]